MTHLKRKAIAIAPLALCMLTGDVALGGAAPCETPGTLCTSMLDVNFGGVDTQVAVTCVDVPDAAPGGRDVLFVHGANHNHSAFLPLWDVLLEQARLEERALPLRRLCGLDLPAHGLSPAPPARTFSNMGLEDYTTILHQVLQAGSEHPGEAQAAPFDTVVTHSMGGMLMQMLGTRLAKTQEQTVTEALGVDRILLMSPTIPEELPWAYAEFDLSELGAQQLVSATRMLAWEPELGPHVYLPPDMFASLFLNYPADTKGKGEVRFPTCSPEEIRGISDVETLTAWGQIYGMEPELTGGTGQRPSISHGVFSQQRLVTVSFRNDQYMPQCEVATLRAWLRGDERLDPALAGELPDYCKGDLAGAEDQHFHVTCTEATHDGFYLVPDNATLLAALESLIRD